MTFEKDNYDPIRCTMDTVTFDVNYVLSVDEESYICHYYEEIWTKKVLTKKKNIFSNDLLNQYTVDILIGQILLEFDSSRIFRMK